jgi:hypothetical protein
VIDQFAKHPWPADTAYFFYVVVGDKNVLRHVEKIQARFDFPGLVPVLGDELHITVLPVAFDGKVAEKQLAELSADTAHAVNSVSRETAALGPVVVDDDQVVLLANPCEGLRSVRETLRQCVQNRLSSDAIPSAGDFRPHISMFYSSGEHPSAPVERVASAINSAGGANDLSTVVGELSLVKVSRVLGHYRNAVIESFQFGDAAH